MRLCIRALSRRGKTVSARSDSLASIQRSGSETRRAAAAPQCYPGMALAVFSLAALFILTFLPLDTSAQGTTLAVNVVNTAQTSTTTSFTFTAGGSTTLTNTNNTTAVLSFPEDFYSEDVRLQTNSYANNFFTADKPALSGKSFVGKTYDFELFASSTGAKISAVSKPITITIRYLDSDISGFDESALAPYRFGTSDSAWQLISGGTVDTANNKVIFSTTLFSSFALFAAPAPAPPPPPPSSPAPSGGGGGGGGILAPIPSVIFSGRAYPLNRVVVLKDGQIAVATIAGPDARFEISLTGLAAGNYNFAVYGEDSKGIRSNVFTFLLSITSGATTKVSGIFIAPTIAIDKSEVKRGDNIAIFGQSVPQAEVTIAVNSEEDFFTKTVADNDGVYLHNFNTALLAMGQHLTKSKAAWGGEISPFGKAVSFMVGTKNVAAAPSKLLKGDLNNDGRINLVDFSIAAYWYQRPLSATFKPMEVERLNGDGNIDLTDISIMAYYWTG